MKIFIEADSITGEKTSGIGHATLEIVRAISDKIKDTDHQLILIVPFGKKDMLARYNFKDVSVNSLPPGYRYVNYVLTRTFLTLPIDLFYGRGIYIFPNYKTWWVPFSTSIMFFHDIAYKIYPESIHPRNIAYLEANVSRWIKRASVIVAISHSSKKEILQYFPSVKKKIRVIYLGVDHSVFYKRTVKEINSVTKKHGIRKKYFIYIGNIEPRKNIGNLLEGYKKYCNQTNNPAQLVIAGGNGWKNEDIYKQIKLLRKTGYDVYVPGIYIEDQDLPALYSGALALTHVSLHEGYGLSLVQAQACGAPVIASDLAVFKETLKANDVKYVSSGNTSDIAQAMSWAHNRRATKTHSVVKHTWADTAEQLTRIMGIM